MGQTTEAHTTEVADAQADELAARMVEGMKGAMRVVTVDAFNAVMTERQHQMARGYDEAHDDAHAPAELAAEAWRRLQQADNLSPDDLDGHERLFRQGAAVCVAALQSVARRRAKAAQP